MANTTKSKKAAPAEAVISDRTWQGRQSWNRERIVTDGGERFRYMLKCDAYDFQSYAKVEVWRTDGWRTVDTIPGPKMASRVSYVTPNVGPHAFDADLAELRRIARLVVSP